MAEPAPERLIAVDAGRSRCRAAIIEPAGGAVGPGTVVTLPSEATLVDPGGPARVAGTIRQAIAALTSSGPGSDPRSGAGPGSGPGSGPGTGPGTVLAVAAAGGMWVPAARALAGELARPGTEVVVAGDVVAAHAGAFDGRPGVVLAVGTGAVALAVDAGGRHALVDGQGFLVGDAGSGFAIGRAGLAAALRYADGRVGGSAALAEAARHRFGQLPELPHRLHAARDAPRQVASFTPAVAEAARAGDLVAVEIWRDAVAELAQTALAAGTGGAAEIVLVGSLFALDDLLTAPLRARIAERRPDLTVQLGAPDALLGAARLARRPSPYEPLVVRSSAAG